MALYAEKTILADKLTGAFVASERPSLGSVIGLIGAGRRRQMVDDWLSGMAISLLMNWTALPASST